MSRCIAVLGTGSDAGKSIFAVALCRYFSDLGLKVAPFKGQNMALNSYVTSDGCEVGRAQALQAYAANRDPTGIMNPILIKPAPKGSSELMVLGESLNNISVDDYYSLKQRFVKVVDDSLVKLMEDNDLIVIEGSGSPSEINIPGEDLANIGLCARHSINAFLIGDIEKGGVIASIVGTQAVIADNLKTYLKAYAINKFHGDARLFDDGINIINRLTGLKSLGIVNWFNIPPIELEDSYSLSVTSHASFNVYKGINCHYLPDRNQLLKIGVVHYRSMSNFSDFDPLRLDSNCHLILSDNLNEIADCDLIILPGTKATVADLNWFTKANGINFMADVISKNSVVLGICGGFQMLAQEIDDKVESKVGVIQGLGVLDATVKFNDRKTLLKVRGIASCNNFDAAISGYQIQHGIVTSNSPWISSVEPSGFSDGAIAADGQVFGTSLHGIFESDDFRIQFLSYVAGMRGKQYMAGNYSYIEAKEKFVQNLTENIANCLDMDSIYELAKRC